MKESPASKAMRLFGVETLRRVTGTGDTAVYRWTYPKDRGGTGGLIPQRYHPAILRAARELGLDFGIEDLAGWAEEESMLPAGDAPSASREAAA